MLRRLRRLLRQLLSASENLLFLKQHFFQSLVFQDFSHMSLSESSFQYKTVQLKVRGLTVERKRSNEAAVELGILGRKEYFQIRYSHNNERSS